MLITLPRLITHRAAKFLLLLTLASATAIAEAEFLTAQELYDSCPKVGDQLEASSHSFCLGYLYASYDSLELLEGIAQKNLICPESKAVKARAILNIFKSYFLSHPEDTLLPAADIVIQALREQYKCTTANTIDP